MRKRNEGIKSTYIAQCLSHTYSGMQQFMCHRFQCRLAKFTANFDPTIISYGSLQLQLTGGKVQSFYFDC